jgi:hypothetical protein
VGLSAPLVRHSPQGDGAATGLADDLIRRRLLACVAAATQVSVAEDFSIDHDRIYLLWCVVSDEDLLKTALRAIWITGIFITAGAPLERIDHDQNQPCP